MLMIPGPTPVPQQILLASVSHPIDHQSGEFAKVMAEVTEGLKWLHQTQNDVFILGTSGTGAMEVGIINFLSSGDRVLVGCNGRFGDRWVELCEAYNLNVTKITAEWGKPLKPEQFRAQLQADATRQIKAVIITHSETSTGVLNDLETINSYVKAHGEALMIVDAVTSLGAVNLPMDNLGLDVVVSASQKGLMIPPGLGFVAVSPKAWKAHLNAKLPRFYFNLSQYRRNNITNNRIFTPPVNLIIALQAALQMMKTEGLSNIFARHQRQMKATRAAIKNLGLPLLTADQDASPALTTVVPDRVEAEQIRAALKKHFNIAIGGGLGHLQGKILRISHLGFVSERDILTTISALEVVLYSLGYNSLPLGAGITAVAKIFAFKKLSDIRKNNS